MSTPKGTNGRRRAKLANYRHETNRLLILNSELLEALKGLMNTPLDHTYCFSESCGKCQECAARAAIAKATGES